MDKTGVNKFLSQSGFCSRREADKLITQGRVTVNNNSIDPGYKVAEEDIVKVDGEIIKNKIKNFTYIAFNKPKGIVCTTDTEREEKNIDRNRRKKSESGGEFGTKVLLKKARVFFGGLQCSMFLFFRLKFAIKQKQKLA